MMAEQYFVPKKEVSSLMDMKKWDESEAYHEYVGFILAMNEAVKGKKISEVKISSKIVRNMYDMLEKIDKWIDEIPPIEQLQDVGNNAFRTFYSKLKNEADSMLELVLPLELHPAIVELSVYLQESFGNSTRIYYGTGHEMFFAMLLCCLFKIGAFKESDPVEVILKVFDRYITLVRKLLVTYRMEPAGRDKVWNLDNYQFLPFLWGSSQLKGHIRLEPCSFADEDIEEVVATDYMFMSCIKFINQVKNGPLSEYSEQLCFMSGLTTWEIINTSLKMKYKHQVLFEHAVIKHVVFGSILSIKEAESSKTMFNLKF